MPGFEIGLSGLTVAQRAIEIIGTNIANVSTAGYHRQTVRAAALDYRSQQNGSAGGVEVANIDRAMDMLLENEILRQRPVDGQLTQELSTLQTIEQSLGTLDSQGLATSLTSFFSALRQLTAQGDSSAYQEQAVAAADDMAGQFRNLGEFLDELKVQIRLDAQNLVSKVNGLATQIAELNGQIQAAQARGESPNVLQDQRGAALSDLGDLVDLQMDSQSAKANGMVNVSAWGIPLVTDGHSTAIEAGMDSDGRLGISIQGLTFLHSDMRGGQIGGLISLHNDLVQDVQDKLDTLARNIIAEVNDLHVQGIGSAGSFTELSGVPAGTSAFGQCDQNIQAGTFFIRVTNTSNGAVSRVAVHVDPADSNYDDLADVASQIDASANLAAQATGGTLRIQASAGYTFDFLTSLSPTPTSSTLAVGTARPSISGDYTGDSNQNYTFKMLGDGTIGLTEGLSVEVRDGSGTLVKTLSVGAGYAAGDVLEVADGIKVAFTAGTTKTNETFTVQALADSDPTGVLAAAGMNTLLQGFNARSITLRGDVRDDPERIAVSSGPGGDNRNIARLSQLQSQTLDVLGGASIVDYCHKIVTGLGQDIAVRQARKTSMDSLMQQLNNQRDHVSGVDINAEAASLMEYEKMFQASAKYLSTLDRTLQYLIDMT